MSGGQGLPGQHTSFIVVTFNGADTIENCLDSIESQSLCPGEVIVIDNHSTDGTVPLVHKRFPRVRLVVNDRNLGYAGANNLGARLAVNDVLCPINQDVTLDANWNREIAQFLAHHEYCAAAEGKLCLSQNPKVLNSGGSYVNVVGFGCATRYGEEDGRDRSPKVVSYASGAAFAVRKQAFADVGGFDEGYFMYHEDVDLGLRLADAGWSIFYVPTAIAYHAYDDRVRPWKMELLERNRWKTLVKDFPIGYFVRCAPLLAMFEIGVTLKLLSLGLFRAKMRAMLGFLEDLPQTARGRQPARHGINSSAAVYDIITNDVPSSISISKRWTHLAQKLQAKYKTVFLSPRPVSRKT